MVDKIERNKDLVQELIESTATHVGSIATIITGAIVDVAREVGEIFTDGFEMREAAKLAQADAERVAGEVAETPLSALPIPTDSELDDIIDAEIDDPAGAVPTDDTDTL